MKCDTITQRVIKYAKTKQARKKSKTGIYHGLLSGINRQTIFEDDEDCAKLSEELRKSKK